MSHDTPKELKKALVQHGFEIYRTVGSSVVIADRVRDNLIMDSGVSAEAGATATVRIVLRAQQSDFPGETPEQLLVRARSLAGSLLEHGYREVSSDSVTVHDPGDKTRTLDVWYEITLAQELPKGADLFEELRFALACPKAAGR